MANYKANHGFDDDRLGKVNRDQPLDLTEAQAKPYERAGLIRLVAGTSLGDSSLNPIPAAGTVQSASRAAPVSPKTTATKQKRGRKPTAGEQSSS
ncbi:hypothetical protein D0C16_05480 [Cellvibrio sp. KY-GH-1]|uniref:hypothetical protein n=1 Tax=Cellvibrio sp. KY-GH-1 TaxID=2303332 RepID=UPI001245D40B|nr:hypothetical protein [Cellvibrio sp. KY-GH-1]QEY15471.1 hypothetical protein D0C16_05480 [Cellvibrio sp. KY-GH-1]